MNLITNFWFSFFYQVVHPICVRQFVSEYEDRNDPTYESAFECGITSRRLGPSITRGSSLSFGAIKCLNHAYCGEQKLTSRTRVCNLCERVGVEIAAANQWTSCKICATHIHTRCAEKVEGLREQIDYVSESNMLRRTN